jgi:phosphoribosylamine--glycine ligase
MALVALIAIVATLASIRHKAGPLKPRDRAMRFLGIGDAADLGSLYLRLAADGHDVKIYIGDAYCQDTLRGLIPQVENWQAELGWVQEAGRDGCILFENVGAGRGELQDRLRAEGFNVIGSSAYGARLENDRAYAQKVLAGFGLPTAPVFEFSNTDAAVDFIGKRPARYVVKSNGPDAATFVGSLPAGADVAAHIVSDPNLASCSFVLMEFVEGIEMGVGAYFNGADFLMPACLDWEHKRFFPGDLGELTGEMGTVVTYRGSKTFFDRTLGKMAPLLTQNGYCGYINLNTVVNEKGIWPLEFTCRFGYPGYAILDPLQRTRWADLFRSMLDRSTARFEVESGFCVGIVITTPPFPYARDQVPDPKGLPIMFRGELSPADQANIHYGEVGLKDGALVTSGASGYTLVVTGTGDTIASARDAANTLAAKVVIPNARYRIDIGEKLIAGDFDKIRGLGLIDS